MYSIYDLAQAFIQRYYDSEPTLEIKTRILDQTISMLKNGWTIEDFQQATDEFDEHSSPTKGIVEPFVLQYVVRVNKDNLLYPGDFYYHNQLRSMPMPPLRKMDYNTGEIKKVEEEFYLEMRASYTINNLIDYFQTQFSFHVDQDFRKKSYGGFSYLLKSNTLEEILFAIDAASNWMKTEDKNVRQFNILNLRDWILKGQDTYWEKVTEAKETGDDRVVPRKRVLTFRGRHPV